MPTPPLLNITVPVFNRPALTLQTLEAVRRSTSVPYVLTVVDNGSDEDTRNLLIAMRDAGKIDLLIRLDRNYGVAVAANAGWRLVDAPLYMKLDNDVVIHAPNWFPVVLAEMQRVGKDAVWGADLNGQMGNPAYVHRRQGITGLTRLHVSGGAIIIPRSISILAGYWSEDYGLYGCEDGDYGERLNALNIHQYYFDHRPFMRHMGHDATLLKTRHGLDKAQEKAVFMQLWKVNQFLYKDGHRAPNIPPLYIPTSFDGYALSLQVNTAGLEIWKAAMDLHNMADKFRSAPKKSLEVLNHFITVQNANWMSATNAAQDAYERLRVQIAQSL